MIEELKAVLERIKSTSSNNGKISILEEFKDDERIKQGLYFLFNDFIITGLSTKKISKQVGALQNANLTTLEQAISYLESNKTGTDVDIANVQYFLSNHEDSRKFLEQYLTKTYKCGITAKSINKAFGEQFIPEFACQLAHPYTKFTDRVNDVFTLTTKLDGHRTIAVVDKFGDTTFFTRKGKPIDGLNDLSADIKDFANGSGILGSVKYNDGFVLDGEAIVSGEVEKSKVFQETGKIIRKDGVKTGIALHVFDLIPTEEFFSGESSDTYNTRRIVMDSFFGKKEYENLKLVDVLYQGKDVSLITSIMDQAVANGEEGLMINLDETYKTKRHPGILKVKEFFTDDLLVTGIFEGNKGSKYEGTLGGVTVDYKGNSVKVGSGFTDDDRDKFFKNPELIVGKVIEVQYFEETTNQKDDGVSLRFPVFLSLRDDKEAEDVNIEE